jgi:hypothetical protein
MDDGLEVLGLSLTFEEINPNRSQIQKDASDHPEDDELGPNLLERQNQTVYGLHVSAKLEDPEDSYDSEDSYPTQVRESPGQKRRDN